VKTNFPVPAAFNAADPKYEVDAGAVAMPAALGEPALGKPESVLLNAGTSIKRDAVDSLIVNQWLGDGTDVGRYGGDGDRGQPGTTGDGLIDSPAEAGGWPSLSVARIRGCDLNGM